jgi:hypothetical protein
MEQICSGRDSNFIASINVGKARKQWKGRRNVKSRDKLDAAYFWRGRYEIASSR